MLRWVSELTDEDSAAVGPKIARLGTLRASGIDVPDGFAVTVDAFEKFLAVNGLDQCIDRELAAASDIDNLAEMEAASNRVRGIIEQTPMDGGLEAALRDAYHELCFRHGDVGLSVAVRSSAAGEDAADASFAGQYESYLGIVGAEAVVTAVRRAWSSLFVARALAYRLRQKQHYRETPMGVGVLRLVHARCAGVAFSANPVSKKRDRFVIEGAWGWGEVGGARHCRARSRRSRSYRRPCPHVSSRRQASRVIVRSRSWRHHRAATAGTFLAVAVPHTRDDSCAMACRFRN